MKTLRPLLFGSLIALALAAPLARAADETPSPWKFEFHGFATASVYTQDQVFASGQGQGLLYAAPAPVNQALPPAGTNTAASPKKKDMIYSGDVRNSRFSFSMAGPKVFDGAAQPRAYLEFDLFGPFNAGAYGTEQPIPRLRVAYAELKFGGSNLQFGQQNQLVVTQIPSSISHIANPVTYGAGTIGWRTPGIRFTQTIDLGDKLELAGELVKNKWSNDANAGNTPAGIGQGEAGSPMFQARVKYDGKSGDITYMAYLVGVWGQQDMSGFGGVLTPPRSPPFNTGPQVKTITTTVGEVGGKLSWNNMVTVAANYYTGKATASMLGSMLNFGDISDTGYWASLAGNFTKELSLMVVYGAGTPNKTDVLNWSTAASAANPVRYANTTMGGMFKYQDGGYALGLEAYVLQTDFATSASTKVQTKGQQLLLTGAYFF